MSSAFAGLAVASATPAAASGSRRIQKSQAQDLGPSDASDVLTPSFVLKVNSVDALEAVVALSQVPGLPTYHRFLSTAQFADLFAPSRNDIKKITAYLAGFGIQVDDVYSDRLLIRARGTIDAFNRAFDVDMHTVTANGKRWHRPNRAAKIPLLLRDLLVSVGLDEEPDTLESSRRSVDDAATSLVQPERALGTPAVPADGVIATGVPGFLTVGDVANRYNIKPLYDAGIDGTGRTIGIASLANFDPEDAYAYWDKIGLSVAPDRITQIHVDGGGELSAAGSGETCLDVEQSGGLAPGAKIIVYDTPITANGMFDVFYRAISDNLVDTLSVSWGQTEDFYYPEVTGEQDGPSALRALHQVFLEAAIQGISMFAVSGDNGAYDIEFGFNAPFRNVLTVSSPGSDPAITAGGGTTLPFAFDFGPGTPEFVVPTEQVWGERYVQDYLVQYVDPSYQNELFPEGGGGGVSTFWPRPYYQAFTPGMTNTKPGQSIIFDPGDGSAPIDVLDLPAGFAGRNLPDISLNADPATGYYVESTEDGGLRHGWGGTSFVAPQLNGIAALLGAGVHGRLGLLNPALYRYRAEYGYGASSPLRDITAGDNWFYAGVPGYDNGAGLGVLDVANLWKAIVRDERSRR